MKLTSKAAACAALSVGLFLGATAPISAQASPIGSGQGAFLAQNQETHLFAFAVVELPDGSVNGHGLVFEPSTRAFVLFRISSFMFLGETLFMAGPITQAVNAPPQFVGGATAFFAVNDNGRSSADDIAALSVVPVQFGNLTIQQILALAGPPPAGAFAPLLAGDVRIHR